MNKILVVYIIILQENYFFNIIINYDNRLLYESKYFSNHNFVGSYVWLATTAVAEEYLLLTFTCSPHFHHLIFKWQPPFFLFVCSRYSTPKAVFTIAWSTTPELLQGIVWPWTLLPCCSGACLMKYHVTRLMSLLLPEFYHL